MKKNSETSYLVSLVQMNGLLVQVVIQGAKGGIVYSVHGWDIKLPTILTMANRYHNLEYTNWFRITKEFVSESGATRRICFAYNQEKELELQTEENELWFNEYKKRTHIQEIVDTSLLTEEEKQWLPEEFAYRHTLTQQTYDPTSRRHVERITMIPFAPPWRFTGHVCILQG